MTPRPARHLLRERQGHESERVSFFELFFDLVFVFAVTQLSHTLLEDFTVAGALRTGLLFMAVWWVWIFTSWCTNWLDPETVPVRLLLVALMLAGLLLAIALPEAFEARAGLFAGAYVAMQVGRSLFMLAAMRGRPAGVRNFQRITIWLAASGVLWIAGAAADHELRIVLWLVALAIEYAAPAAGFLVPGLGRSTTADWDVAGGHLAERCGLFIIIALGESILVSGATLAAMETWSTQTVAAFATAFIGSVAMWWIYFNIGAARASRAIAASGDPGRLARLAYTYLHLPIVAGIVIVAVADELVLAHPDGHLGAGTVAALLGGPALYLVGNLLFKWATWGRAPFSHLVGLALLGVCLVVADSVAPLSLAVLTTAVLILVAVWESISLGRAAE